MKVVSSGGKDGPLKAVSMVNIQDFYQFLIWSPVFLVSVCAFLFVKLLKVFWFYKWFVTNISNFTSKSYIL